jgi:flagellar motility protein MotE (MotC chaperone)
MAKVVKIGMAAIVPIVVILALGYGLARFGILPVDKIAEKNGSLGSALKAVGLYEPHHGSIKVSAASDPLAGEKKALQAQRDELNQERSAMETQADKRRQDEQKQRDAESAALPDAKSLARLATIYESMQPAVVDKIFAKLPNSEMIAILRRMDEKKVAEYLAAAAPERAARITLELARPAPEPASGAHATP